MVSIFVPCRRSSLPLAGALALALSSGCGPSESGQTIAFVLGQTPGALTEIEFVASYTSGDFVGNDGKCRVSSAAGAPTSARALRAERRVEKAAVRLVVDDTVSASSASSTSSTSSTSMSTTTTEEPTTTTTEEPTTTTTEEPATTTTGPTTTTTAGPTTTTTTISTTTTTAVAAARCGDGKRDAGEMCDDGNNVDGDDCSADCLYYFKAVDSPDGELTITIRSTRGIPSGATLAFCNFEGSATTTNVRLQTTSCARLAGGSCDPATQAPVTVTTTTTMRTTTTSVTSTSSTVTTTRPPTF